MKRIACACKNENSHENAVFVLNDIFTIHFNLCFVICMYLCICTGANKQEKVQITCGMVLVFAFLNCNCMNTFLFIFSSYQLIKKQISYMYHRIETTCF